MGDKIGSTFYAMSIDLSKIIGGKYRESLRFTGVYAAVLIACRPNHG